MSPSGEPASGEPARPLRDVFTDLASSADARGAHAADPAGFLAAHGHPGLPGDLVSEAIVNYADTAPAEVAEHLAPFVIAHSPVPSADDAGPDGRPGLHGLDLLASAPTGPVGDELAVDHLGLGADPDDHLAGTAGQHAGDPVGHGPTDHADPFGIDFGAAHHPGHHLGGDFGDGDAAADGMHLGYDREPVDDAGHPADPDDLHHLGHDLALDAAVDPGSHGLPEAGGWQPEEDHHTMYEPGHDPGPGAGDWLPDAADDAHHHVPPEDLTDL